MTVSPVEPREVLCGAHLLDGRPRLHLAQLQEPGLDAEGGELVPFEGAISVDVDLLEQFKETRGEFGCGGSGRKRDARYRVWPDPITHRASLARSLTHGLVALVPRPDKACDCLDELF